MEGPRKGKGTESRFIWGELGWFIAVCSQCFQELQKQTDLGHRGVGGEGDGRINKDSAAKCWGSGLWALGSGLGTLLIRASASLLPSVPPSLPPSAQNPQLRSCPWADTCHHCPGLCFLDSRGLQQSGRAWEAGRQAGLHPNPGSECPWAGHLIILSLSFLICEMGRVVPLLWSIQILWGLKLLQCVESSLR